MTLSENDLLDKYDRFSRSNVSTRVVEGNEGWQSRRIKTLTIRNHFCLINKREKVDSRERSTYSRFDWIDFYYL